ncbi:MAG: flavodoxin domain-containing protein [Candidatus Aureabacteria bacterium]|nr:flavodoxin domain-containing protein [Candidatus Auribacterota bacterium]
MARQPGDFTAVKVSERVYWVGAIDWAVRDFHGYSTDRGTTYNAYLIMGEKNILVDTVKAPFREEMFARIASVIDPQRIDYLISNHSEMDHSGCLPEVIQRLKTEKVFASAMGVRALAGHFHHDYEVQAVKDGEHMALGNVNLVFAETRMLHWPDSMVTYLPDEALLFSQDAFGMHLASSERFDDELPGELLAHEAAKYYANILMPFAGLVSKLPEKLERNGVAPKIVAPDHGPIWRKGVATIMECYAKWAARTPSRKAVLVYDTMWGSTHRLARAIAEGLAADGVSVKLLPLGSSHRSDAATELLDAGALIVGSPTINNGIFPTVADAMSYLKGLKPSNLLGAAFGSYGWSGESVKELNEMLRAMKIELVSEGVSVRYVPGPDALAQCASLGATVAQRLATLCSGG